MGRRSYRGQEWANRDLILVGILLALLWLGAWDGRYFFLAGVYFVALVGVFAVRRVRRVRRWRKEPPSEFWVDKVK